jgi:integrase
VLRAALTCAVEDQTIARNPVTAVKMTKRREPIQHRKRQAWTVEDARWFLESAWHTREALYAAFVLVLVLGLRRGEVLGLPGIRSTSMTPSCMSENDRTQGPPEAAGCRP